MSNKAMSPALAAPLTFYHAGKRILTSHGNSFEQSHSALANKLDPCS